MKKEQKMKIENQLKGINELLIINVDKLEKEKSKCSEKIKELNQLFAEEQQKIKEYVNFKNENGISRPLEELLEYRLIKENLYSELKTHEKLLMFYKNELKKIYWNLSREIIELLKNCKNKRDFIEFEEITKNLFKKEEIIFNMYFSYCTLCVYLKNYEFSYSEYYKFPYRIFEEKYNSSKGKYEIDYNIINYKEENKYIYEKMQEEKITVFQSYEKDLKEVKKIQELLYKQEEELKKLNSKQEEEIKSFDIYNLKNICFSGE